MLCLGPVFAPHAHSAIFTVNVTVLDQVDNNPGDGACRISSGDFCTLRAAVMEANALPGTDIIVLPGNATIHLDIQGSGAGAAIGDLDINDSVLIGTFIVADDQYPVIDASGLDDRIFDVHAVSQFTLQHVILSGGHAASGGAIYLRDGIDQAQISRVKFENNTADNYGGALYALHTPLTIEDSVFNGNTANSGGAAIVNDCGVMNVNRSSFWNNTHPGELFATSTLLATRKEFDTGSCVSNLEAVSMTFGDGAAVEIDNPFDTKPILVSLLSSTIKNNANAIHLTTSTESSILLINDIFDDSAGSGQNCRLDGTYTLHGLSKYNLDTGHSCQSILGTPAWVDADAGTPIFGSDGWHRFYYPEFDEPTVDIGDSCGSTDLLGIDRPLDGDGDGMAQCDLGAIETINTRPDIFMDGFEN